MTPLPSADQVLASVASGRPDPFAPLGARARGASRAGGASRPAPLSLPSGLVFNGVIRSGGVAEALVQFGGETGTLRVGQKGGRLSSGTITNLLPPGWSVAAIDVQRGRLTLKQGKRTVSAEL